LSPSGALLRFLSQTNEIDKGDVVMFWKTAPILATLALALPGAAGDRINPPQVPANLEVPAGHRPFSMAQAEGTQNYICLPSAGVMTWTFLGPQATLFGRGDGQIMTHFLSPNPDENNLARATWQDSRDSSAVWAVTIANSTDPSFVEQGAVPWLLLRVVGVEYGPQFGDRLTKTTFVQRVNTSGGSAPADGCSQPSDLGKRAMVPYRTDYVFYR
jgi:hypothetical protein